MDLIRKIWTSKAGGDPTKYVGRLGEMWYDNLDGLLRYSDGVTPGGIFVVGAGGAGGNIDGGVANSNYGGIDIIDAGGI